MILRDVAYDLGTGIMWQCMMSGWEVVKEG